MNQEDKTFLNLFLKFLLVNQFNTTINSILNQKMLTIHMLYHCFFHQVDIICLFPIKMNFIFKGLSHIHGLKKSIYNVKN